MDLSTLAPLAEDQAISLRRSCSGDHSLIQSFEALQDCPKTLGFELFGNAVPEISAPTNPTKRLAP